MYAELLTYGFMPPFAGASSRSLTRRFIRRSARSDKLTVRNTHVCAGGVAGAAGVLAGQPLDTVRIRLQQPGCPWGSAGVALRATIAREGTTALFKGVTYPLATISFQVRF